MIAALCDTIAAVATPPGRGGIGVVRVSGARTADIARAIAGRTLTPRVATLCAFADAEGGTIDQGIALFFAAPNSYTGEAVLELQGHGGPMVLRLVLARCLELGARLAQPGEFTQRAFLNGKLDLAQAESVADLIDAATTTAARAATRSLSGAFSREIREVVNALVELRMFTEATLDFPEEEIDFLHASDAQARLARIDERLHAILSTAIQGALLRDGCTAVLIGQPNVGKSSLLNALAADDVAIVTDIAGTTRDTVSRAIDLNGIPLTVVDTAGLRTTHDAIETLGIERTWAAVRNADVALVLVDARHDGDIPAALGAADRAIVEQLPAALPRIVVHNKVDLVAQTTLPRVETVSRDVNHDDACCQRHVWLSAKTGAGMDRLRGMMLAIAGAAEHLESAFLARERHLIALREAQGHLAAAHELLREEPVALELFADELRRAQNALSTITGEFSADDLLGVIFARFCVGK